MSREEILALSPEALFAAVREKLFPWDETCCRVCGGIIGESSRLYTREDGSPCPPCTREECGARDGRRMAKEHRSDYGPNLSGWSGVGLMVEAMRERFSNLSLSMYADNGWCCNIWDVGMAGHDESRVVRGINSETAPLAVARAVLLALENQP